MYIVPSLLSVGGTCEYGVMSLPDYVMLYNKHDDIVISVIIFLHNKRKRDSPSVFEEVSYQFVRWSHGKDHRVAS